jgi:hypothetical protein
MKEDGFEFVIFDKENTLTLPGKREFGSEEVGHSLKHAMHTFG